MSVEKIRRNLKQLLLYGVIGSFAATVDFISYSILTIVVGVGYILANSMSVLFGIITSFSLNRTFNFKVTDKIVVRFGLFLSIGLFGLVISNAILWIGVEKCNFPGLITKVVSIFIVALIQFVFNKLITFK